MMNKIETIVFDLDNTLYNFKYFWEKAHYELYKNLNMKEVDYNTFMKECLIQDKVLWNDIVAGKIDLNELRIIRPYITFKKLGIDKSRKFCKEFYLRMFDILINGMFIESEINNILSNLKDNYKLYILTNGLKKEQEMRVDKLGISKYFENIIISESMGYEKPDLKAFYYLISKFGITPHYTIMIGSSYISDIGPSIKLGFNTLHIDYEKLVKLGYNFNEDILEQFKDGIVWS